jgi:hypothetical protein
MQGIGALCLLAILVVVVAAFFCLCKWIVVIPACVVEQLSTKNSLERSAWLTYGNRLKICGLILLMFILSGLCSKGTKFILGFVPDASLFVVPIHMVLNMVSSAIRSVMVAVVYCDLRAAKEGVPVENLADIAD